MSRMTVVFQKSAAGLYCQSEKRCTIHSAMASATYAGRPASCRILWSNSSDFEESRCRSHCGMDSTSLFGLAVKLVPRTFGIRRSFCSCFVASLAYSLFLYAYLSSYAAGADASGYLNFSRLLTHDDVLARVRTLSGHAVAAFGAGTYQPQGFPERGLLTVETGASMRACATNC
jgi:hypothetical protein